MTASAGPKPSRFASELAFALSVAERAGALAVELADRLERIEHKSPRDVVTEADHASEALILEAIRAAYPADALLAEETGEHDAGDGAAATSGRGRAWVVDPLDGTVNYANGIPFWAVSIALVEDGRPVMGVVRDPVRGEAFAATIDGPATLDGQPVACSTKSNLADFVVHISLTGGKAPTRARAIRRLTRVGRSLGSAALGLSYVANGRLDAYAQQGGLSTWDVAAAGLIAERAGAVVTELDGSPWFDIARPTKAMGLLAAPPAHHGALLALARGR
jgi:myo-inositol-1(or 4)-monophosphatase